jgi:hypothetical protein
MKQNDDLKLKLITADKADNLLSEIYDASISALDDRNTVSMVIAELHNEGSIDIVEAFKVLTNTHGSTIDFFLARHVFEEALPLINSQVEPVMECVLHLYRAAGHDMAAGFIFVKFIDFCEKKNRAQEAIKKIEANPEKYADLLTSSLIAGSRSKPEAYISEALRLSYDENFEIKKRALFSLGKIEMTGAIELTLIALEDSLKNHIDDELCGSVVKSAFSLYKKFSSEPQRINALIKESLHSGGDNTLHSAAETLWLDRNDISDDLLDIFLEYLLNVNPQNIGTLNILDHGIASLVAGSKSEKAIEFIQKYLLINSDNVSLSSFRDTSSTIKSNRKLLEKLTTKWFLKGDRILCDGIRHISSNFHETNIDFEIDNAELPENSPVHTIFIARKIVGHLFFVPYVALSFLVSILKATNDTDLINEVAKLILDPLLLSHPNILERLISRQDVQEDAKLKSLFDNINIMLEDYLNGIRSAGKINELNLDASQREIYMRRMSQLMAESYKNAEQESSILKFIPKSVLLYGRKTINHVFTPDGQSHRTESGLHSYSTTIEVPRMEIIDPISLDYVLRIYRVERFRQ